MEWLQLILAFFVANALGYGGGPASIPLMYEEIVSRYRWMDDLQFSNLLAVANALPGPIATKIAAFVGFDVAGPGGAALAIAATVVPSAAALILLIRILERFRQSSAVRGMTLLVMPVIAMLMAMLTWQIGSQSVASIGIWQSLAIAAASWWLLVRRKVHPAYVIVAAFAYGGLILSRFA